MAQPCNKTSARSSALRSVWCAGPKSAVDFYPEGVLLWLEADTIIRQRTGGSKSLDDFCHLFHGGQSGGPTVKTYTFDEVVSNLNQVCPFDWGSFWWRNGLSRPSTTKRYRDREDRLYRDSDQRKTLPFYGRRDTFFRPDRPAHVDCAPPANGRITTIRRRLGSGTERPRCESYCQTFLGQIIRAESAIPPDAAQVLRAVA
jgi:hypothetical protein